MAPLISFDPDRPGSRRSARATCGASARACAADPSRSGSSPISVRIRAHGLLDAAGRTALHGRPRARVAHLDLLHDLAHSGLQVAAISVVVSVVGHGSFSFGVIVAPPGVAWRREALALGHGEAAPRQYQRPRLRRRPIEQPSTTSVERALASVPPPFARALDEVAIVVEDRPSLEQRRSSGPAAGRRPLRPVRRESPGPNGRPTGRPSPTRSPSSASPWRRTSRTRTSWRTRSGVTVLHELAHYLGIDDDRLHELGVE